MKKQQAQLFSRHPADYHQTMQCGGFFTGECLHDTSNAMY